MIVDPALLGRTGTYFLMTQIVVPRPIAWVLTGQRQGGYNLAPFSYFNAVSSAPPLVMISIDIGPEGRVKDTRANIERERRFVVHIASEDQVEAVNESSASLPAGESEVDRLRLELSDFAGCDLPRLSECKAAMYCSLHKADQIAAGQMLFFGKVESIWLDDRIAGTAGGRISVDALQLRPLARLGAGFYAQAGQIVTRKRPD